MNSSARTRKVAFISTSNYALRHFLAPHVAEVGGTAAVSLICNSEHGRPEPATNVTVHEIPIARQPRPMQDLAALFLLIRLLARERFDEIYTISPKGGFLGSVAGWAVRVPVRVHFFTGQVWATSSGARRWLYRMIDRLAGWMCTHALIDSPSQRDFLIDQGLIAASKSEVLGSGSIRGVDADKFRPDTGARKRVRSAHDIADNQIVFLFLGRLTEEKGVLELLDAFAELADGSEAYHLCYVGPDEGSLGPLRARAADIGCGQHVSFVPFTDAPQDYLAMADVFCLPSHREGFPMVVLEAASTGLPTVASDIVGTRDAVRDGQTGLLHVPRDVNDLAAKMKVLADDAELRARLGAAARTRCQDEFSERLVMEEFARFRERVGPIRHG